MILPAAHEFGRQLVGFILLELQPWPFMGGTILQNYTFELSVNQEVFYSGKSSFGFFVRQFCDRIPTANQGLWQVRSKADRSERRRLIDSRGGTGRDCRSKRLG